MKLNLEYQIPENWDQDQVERVVTQITDVVNLLAEGRMSGTYLTASTIPTVGAYALGDFVRNSNPSEQNSVAAGVAAKYVNIGWICTSPTTPSTSATFKECRVLTGN